MLKDLTNYREALNRLLQFAVDHTGAERAVLLIQKKESSCLQIVASLNCDDTSLRDVADFSSNLPRDSITNILPLVIENARTDRRTKDYQSVAYHNILSVACVPLVDGERLIGALYLDHHAIPALFEPEDLEYISSIANFLTIVLSTAREFRNLRNANLQLLEDLNRLGDPNSFITNDPSLMKLFDRLPQIARADVSVLLVGESGTGKELVCQMIHKLSQRSGEPLVKVNCAAITQTLIESELFGVARNTATGVAERDGKFAAADGGTLYLDEIADMSSEMQAKVLRVLEYQQFEKVGSNKQIHTDIRYIYATNRNLTVMVKEGKFREDLYYRINRIVIEIPPLRERSSDVELLTDHYTRIFSLGKRAPRFTSGAMDILNGYHWPGNARQLRNLVERYCILNPGERIDSSDLPPEIIRDAHSTSDHQRAASVEAAQIRAVLERSSGNQSQAAAILSMPLSTMRRKIKKYNIT